MATGSVCVSCVVTKSDAVNSLKDMMAANSQPPNSPGASSGIVTVNSTRKGDAPRLAAACSKRSSRFSIDT